MAWLLDLRKKPFKIILSAAVVVLMAALTVFSWDGIPKRLVICTGLTVLSGALMLLPKLPNRITIPLLAVYLYYVPTKIFERIELPMQDMDRLLDGAAELTAALIVCVCLLIFLFTQHFEAALGGGSAFFLIVFLLEYYIRKFRGDFLMPNDLGAAGTAFTIMGNYRYDLSPEALYTVIYFLFFIVLGAKIRIRMNRWIHAGVSVLAVLAIGSWYYIVMETPKPLGKEFIINYWGLGDTLNLNGACLSYFLLLKDSRMDVPRGYSEKELETIAAAAAADYEPADQTAQKPDIIMIMNEAWSDLRALGELETTKESMAFTDSLTENTIKSNLYVSILGGLTANTEFEALTGNSLAFLAPAAIPYQNQVRHDMPSLAKVLEEQGYETMAMHPSGEAPWSRGKVYGYFGFQEFIHQGVWEVPYEYVRTFISDACNYREIINRYEKRNKDAPFFLFDVTIQNHGGYYGEEPKDVEAVSVGGVPAETVGDLRGLQTYLSLIKVSDEAIKELVTYFEKVDKPVVLCIFGDHQPLMGDNFYQSIFGGQNLSDGEQNLRKYMVPYIIWANYDIDWEEYGDMSANYLPAALLECAGLELPPFYQFLLELHREYPVLTKRGCLDKNGNLTDIRDIWEAEPIRAYRMMQYHQLYVKNYRRDIFEEKIVKNQ